MILLKRTVWCYFWWSVQNILWTIEKSEQNLLPSHWKPQKFTRYDNVHDMYVFRHDWAVCILVTLFRWQWSFTSSMMPFELVLGGGSGIWQTGDANTIGGDANLSFGDKFPENCMKMKEIRPRRVGGVPGSCFASAYGPVSVLLIATKSIVCWSVWLSLKGYKWWFFFFHYGDLITTQCILWQRGRCNNCSHVNGLT